MNNRELAPVEVQSQMSPQMAALGSAKQRAFIEAYFTRDARGEFLTAAAAARCAGYSPNGTPHQQNSAAQKLLADPRIQAAIESEGRSRFRRLTPKAVGAAEDILFDRYHKDRAKIAMSLLERIDPSVTRVDAHVTHEVVDHRRDALNELRALIKLAVPREKLEELYGYTGLLALERQLAEGDKGEVITAEFTEIEPEEDWTIE